MTDAYQRIWKELGSFAKEDATVVSCLRSGEMALMPAEDMLLQMAKMLASEKKTYFEEVLKLTSMSMHPPTLVVHDKVLARFTLGDWFKQKLQDFKTWRKNR